MNNFTFNGKKVSSEEFLKRINEINDAIYSKLQSAEQKITALTETIDSQNQTNLALVKKLETAERERDSQQRTALKFCRERDEALKLVASLQMKYNTALDKNMDIFQDFDEWKCKAEDLEKELYAEKLVVDGAKQYLTEILQQCDEYKRKAESLEKELDRNFRGEIAAKARVVELEKKNELFSNYFATYVAEYAEKFEILIEDRDKAQKQIKQQQSTYTDLEADYKGLQAQVAILTKAVEWMKSVGEFFRYKAPEQIDATKLVASMYATAEEALSTTPTEATEQLQALIGQAVDVWNQSKSVRDRSEYEPLRKTLDQTMEALAKYRGEK